MLEYTGLSVSHHPVFVSQHGSNVHEVESKVTFLELYCAEATEIKLGQPGLGREHG